jgi:N6-L-threonylcarbamoyladenine synthase
MKNKNLITLAIESSCDETAAAVTADGREVLSNVVASQIEVHRVFGGVVPEIAARHHLTDVNFVVEQALAEAGVTFEDVDIIGATEGPGLVGSVLIGLATANAIAYAANKPLVGVHHIKGHVFAAFLEYPELEPPFVALVVSGGHTDLIDVRNYDDFKLLGSTRDDAVGEAFDKVARVLGLGYPGGPKVDALAKDGDERAIEFKRVYLEKNSLDFSFSGIKTGVMNYINTERQAGREINEADVAASFQASVTDVIVAKTVLALRVMSTESHASDILRQKKLVVGGGVAANSYLRARLTEACKKEGAELFIPSLKYCGDNAAMIACAAYYAYRNGKTSALGLDAKSQLQL